MGHEALFIRHGWPQKNCSGLAGSQRLIQEDCTTSPLALALSSLWHLAVGNLERTAWRGFQGGVGFGVGVAGLGGLGALGGFTESNWQLMLGHG